MARSPWLRWFVVGTLALVQYRLIAPASGRAVQEVAPANGTLAVESPAVSPVPRHLFDRVRGCFEAGQLGQCFRDEVLRLMDRAIDGNVTFRVTPFVIVRKNPAWKAEMAVRVTGRDGWAAVFDKLRAFLGSRLLQLSLVDEQGQWAGSLPGLLPSMQDLEGRGKKHKQKHGGMFSMALMALMAMIAQVILGKVAVLAAVALIMAKIALVFSTLNGLKKSTGSGAGHATEHVVYDHGGGGGGGGGGGWQRSIDPRKPYQRYQYYEDEDPLPYRKRKQVYDYQDPMDGA
uniref:Protein osiris 10 n=1 Tax=Anopheles albimanus TaxID=7167 RepID=A0A8W7K8W3_ANOAL